MNPYDPIQQLRGEVQQLRGELQNRANETAQLRQHVNGGVAAARKLAEEADKRLKDLAEIAGALRGSRSGAAGVVRIEDIPGRRVPFVLLVEIPIANNTTSQREQSVTISQEGPFVAVRRMATFLSALEFQQTLDNITTRFAGRSYGRFRPIHSAWDIEDAQTDSITTTPNPFIAATLPFVTNIPSSKSGFRTMEFDGRINVVNAGSSYPRQNISVPSSMWTPQINAPQDLGCLDFFERGEVLTLQVTPTHVNNPSAGNQPIPGVAASYPFLAGQYDAHEGIITAGFTVSSATPPVTTRITTDVITRLPDGILILGWEGYRIIQPVGPVG